MREITLEDKKFLKELMAEKAIITKLMTFLADENACKNAGYPYYKKYTFNNAYVTGKRYIASYDHRYEDSIHVLFCRDYRYKDKYEIEGYITGVSFNNFVKNFIKEECPSILTDPEYEHLHKYNDEEVLDDNRPLITVRINTNSDKIYKPFDPLKVMNDMKMVIDYMYIFPKASSHSYLEKSYEDGSYKRVIETDKLTLDNLSLSDKFITKLIKGIK